MKNLFDIILINRRICNVSGNIGVLVGAVVAVCIIICIIVILAIIKRKRVKEMFQKRVLKRCVYFICDLTFIL